MPAVVTKGSLPVAPLLVVAIKVYPVNIGGGGTKSADIRAMRIVLNIVTKSSKNRQAYLLHAIVLAPEDNMFWIGLLIVGYAAAWAIGKILDGPEHNGRAE